MSKEAPKVPYRLILDPALYSQILRGHGGSLKAAVRAVCFVYKERATAKPDPMRGRESGYSWPIALKTLVEESGQGETAARKNRREAIETGWLYPVKETQAGVILPALSVPQSAWVAFLDCQGGPGHSGCVSRGRSAESLAGPASFPLSVPLW